MLTATKVGPNRLDLSLSGAIDADVMRAALSELLESSKGMVAGRMLYTIESFEMPTLGAIGVELSMMPQLFGLVGRFSKCAVLCDTAWIRTVGEWEGRLMPGLEIKAFPLADREAAEAWLEGGD